MTDEECRKVMTEIGFGTIDPDADGYDDSVSSMVYFMLAMPNTSMQGVFDAEVEYCKTVNGGDYTAAVDILDEMLDTPPQGTVAAESLITNIASEGYSENEAFVDALLINQTTGDHIMETMMDDDKVATMVFQSALANPAVMARLNGSVAKQLTWGPIDFGSGGAFDGLQDFFKVSNGEKPTQDQLDMFLNVRDNTMNVYTSELKKLFDDPSWPWTIADNKQHSIVGKKGEVWTGVA